MGKIKSKLLCLGSLLLGFYLVSNVLPFPSFIDEVFITALAFPFFSRKFRIRITLAVQGMFFVGWVYRTVMMYMKYGDMAWSMVKNKLEFGSYLGGSEVSLIPESISNVGSNLVQSFGFIDQSEILFKILYPTQYFIYQYLLSGILVTGLIIFFVLVISLIIIGFTSPYSIYLIIDKLGFYRLVERNTKGTINFKEPWIK